MFCRTTCGARLQASTSKSVTKSFACNGFPLPRVGMRKLAAMPLFSSSPPLLLGVGCRVTRVSPGRFPPPGPWTETHFIYSSSRFIYSSYHSLLMVFLLANPFPAPFGTAPLRFRSAFFLKPFPPLPIVRRPRAFRGGRCRKCGMLSEHEVGMLNPMRERSFCCVPI